MAWWGWTLVAERREMRQTVSLAAELPRSLRETLYAQLPAAHKQALDTIYQAHDFPTPGQRFP